MKINRVDIMISACENKHKRFLYNEVLNLARKEKIGGEFRPNSIKLSAMPEEFLKVLEDLKIKFERIKK